MGPHLERAFGRIPAAATAGVRKLFCGPESFTPDLAPLVGEAPGLRNCWVAAGLNSLGILYGPGIGNVIARWIVEGACPVDHTGFNVDRFADGSHNTPAFRRARTPELLAKSFGAHFPNSTFTTARGLKQSVLLRPAQRGRGVLHREPRLGAARLVRANARTGAASTATAGAGSTGSTGMPRSIARLGRTWS